MEFRPLDINVISADDLKNVNLMSMMDVYTVVSISAGGDSYSTFASCKTPVHRDCGSSPNWNHRLQFSVAESSLAKNSNVSLHFHIMSHRPLGDKVIGDVSVPLHELLENASSDASELVGDYKVKTPSGKFKGTLKFSYKFGEKIASPPGESFAARGIDPVTAYPAAAPYPPPQGYGYPQQPHYGHPGGAPEYAYPPQPSHGHPGGPPEYVYPPQQGHPGGPPEYGYGQPGGVAPGYGYAAPPQQGHPGCGAPGYGYAYPPQQGHPGGSGAAYAGPPAGYPGAAAAEHEKEKKKKKKKKGNKFGLGMGTGFIGGLLAGEVMSEIGEMASAFGDVGFEF